MKYTYDPESLWNISGERVPGADKETQLIDIECDGKSMMARHAFTDRLMARFFRKRSYVESLDGKVVYRRRKFHWLMPHMAAFIEYHFDKITKLKWDWDGGVMVVGDISAVYLTKDGRELRRKQEQYTVIPGCFCDMQGMIEALKAVRDK